MKDAKPRILILTHCFPSDRSDIPGNFLIDLCSSLHSLGAEVFVLTQKMDSQQDEDFLSTSKAKINYFNWSGGDERFAGLKLSSFSDLTRAFSLIYNGCKAMKKLVKATSPDLILNCWVVPSGLWSLFICKKIKKAVWALGSDIGVYGTKPLFRSVIKTILKKNSLVFTNSLSIQKEIFDMSGIKSELLYTSRKIPASKQNYQSLDLLRLIFIGRLEKVKGPDLLINALINSGIENYDLKIVGDGPMREEFEKLSESNGAGNKIHFTGSKNAQEIADLLRVSDYLVISSLKESMPVVFWEAMQTSTPVLATDTGDIKYYCDKYNVGRTCPADERSLSELISFVNNLRPLRKKLSENTSTLSDLVNIERSAEKIFRLSINQFEKKV
jgi:glycosyltransferase involved in cell wall biosynthesis